MLFVEVATGKPKTKIQLQQENKHMSLPSSWTDATLEALGVARVTKTAAPDVGEWQVAVKDGATQDANGNWVQAWKVVDMFQDYTDDEGVTHTKADQEAAYQADLDAKAAASVRTQRDKLLAESDWVTVKAVDQNAQDSLGIQVPQVWLDYRQALRNIPQQAGFPSTITWPEKPE